MSGSGDVVSQMMTEMGVAPQQLQQMSAQQQMMQQPTQNSMVSAGMMQPGGQPGMMQPGGQPAMMQGQGAPHQGMPDLQAMSPQEQMQYMAAMRQQNPQMQGQMEQAPQPEVESSSDSSDSSDESEGPAPDMSSFGMESKPNGMLDNVFDSLKAPIMVLVIFVVLNLPQVGEILDKVLPLSVLVNQYYLLAVKAFLAAALFFGVNTLLN